MTIQSCYSLLQAITRNGLSDVRSFATKSIPFKGSDFFLINGVKLDPKRMTILPSPKVKKPILHYSGFFNNEELGKIREVASGLHLEAAKVNVAAKKGDRVEQFSQNFAIILSHSFQYERRRSSYLLR